MAGPVTHIVFAKEFLDNNPLMRTQEFVVGTSFPDIRYLGALHRDQTHLANVAPEQFHDLDSPFMSGVVFHNYIDVNRAAYWEKTGIHATLPQSPYLITALKFYEDILFYDRIADWSGARAYLEASLGKKAPFEVSQEIVDAWNKSVRDYIVSSPDSRAIGVLLKTMRLDQDAIDEVNRLVSLLAKYEGLPEAIDAMYSALSDAILAT